MRWRVSSQCNFKFGKRGIRAGTTTLHNTLRISTSSIASPFFLSFFLSKRQIFFVLVESWDDRITSRMAFNVFSTSINICSFARYFSSSSFPHRNRERSFLHSAESHTRVFTTAHQHTYIYTYARVVPGSQSKRNILGLLLLDRKRE